jgi:hypothetical protein
MGSTSKTDTAFAVQLQASQCACCQHPQSQRGSVEGKSTLDCLQRVQSAGGGPSLEITHLGSMGRLNKEKIILPGDWWLGAQLLS